MYQAGPVYEKFANKLKRGMKRLIRKTIRGKCLFGALVECTVAFTIELDLARLAIKKKTKMIDPTKYSY